MNLRERTAVHAALGDEGRLRVVELLSDGDLTVRELGTALGMPGNLLAHHLNVLEEAGVIARLDSDGDRRRRYVTLRREVLDGLIPLHGGLSGSGVCLQSQLCTLPMRGGVLEFRHRRGSGERGESSQRPGSPDRNSSRPRAGHRSECRRPQGIRVDHFRSGRPHLGLRPRPTRATPEARRRLHWSIPDPLPAGRSRTFARPSMKSNVASAT